MPLLPRKGMLAIAAVIDIAIHARGRPVAAKALAARHRLPPRYLEPVLQTLVREGILKGVRGPRGGYELARDLDRISADDILRAAGTAEEGDQASRTDRGFSTRWSYQRSRTPNARFRSRSRASALRIWCVQPSRCETLFD